MRRAIRRCNAHSAQIRRRVEKEIHLELDVTDFVHSAPHLRERPGVYIYIYINQDIKQRKTGTDAMMKEA